MYSIKQKSNYLFVLQLNNDNDYNNLFEISLKYLMKNCHYNTDLNQIYFNAEHVFSLQDYLQRNNFKMELKLCLKMIETLYKQYNLLLKQNFSIIGFNLDNIIIVDNEFIYIGPIYYSKKFVLLNEPINIPYFSSPELLKLTNLPEKIPNESFIYSLGVLCVFCLKNEYVLKGNDILTDTQMDLLLKKVCCRRNKLYWFLKRCLYIDPKSRRCILI
jgi:hypothetical protein